MNYELKIIKTKYKRSTIKIIEEGLVELRISKYADEGTALKWLKENEKFISKSLEKIKSKNIIKQRINKDTKLAIVGQEVVLENKFEELKKDQKVEILKIAHKSLENYLKDRILYFESKMQVKSKGFKIGRASKIYGSCKMDNSLRFSLMISFLPERLIDYVVVHELAHIRFKHHQKEFWDFVGKNFKDYKRAKEEIKGYSCAFILNCLIN